MATAKIPATEKTVQVEVLTKKAAVKKIPAAATVIKKTVSKDTSNSIVEQQLATQVAEKTLPADKKKTKKVPEKKTVVVKMTEILSASKSEKASVAKSVAAPVAQTTLSPHAAWPFPTASKP